MPFFFKVRPQFLPQEENQGVAVHDLNFLTASDLTVVAHALARS